ncbi:MAG: sigma-70 family RNA polymerase sigma factor [Candidatus Sericytochromatia bacterium]|nr:sigma-70 family RNA polymerase sigma factor [Candidatus Sericytochromatia bacterium]
MQIAIKKNLSKSQKSEIVAAYYALVKKIAFNLSKASIDPVEDLIQVGFIGLLEAAENFKEIHKTLFKTYATHYISGHIRHYLRDKQSLLRGPRPLQELSNKMSTAIKELSQQLGREPSNNEIAERISITNIKVDEIKNYQAKISLVWLDQAINSKDEEDNRQKIDSLIDTKNSSGDRTEDLISLRDAIQKISNDERSLLELRYFKDMTQSELARLYGISQMEICRKIKRAEESLKKIIN